MGRRKKRKKEQPELFDTNIYEREILPKQEQQHADYIEGARAWARAFGADGRLVNVNDVRAGFGPPPVEKDPRLMGAIFQTVGKNAEWVEIKRERTARRICHNRPIGFFRLRFNGQGSPKKKGVEFPGID